MKWFRFARLLVLLSSIAIIAILTTRCGGGANSSGSGTNSSPSRALTTDGTSLSFGSVAVGSSKPMTFTLTNTGTASVTVSQLTVTGSAFTVALSLPITLSTGQNTTITVTFSPQSSGTATGRLAIVSDAPTAPTISLSGTGVVPSLTVMPAVFSFGDVYVGTAQVLGGTLTASGANITVSSGSATGTPYSLTAVQFPVTIPDGQSVAFNILFAPLTAGAAQGTVSFVHNAPNSPAVATLSGNAIPAPAHTALLTWDPSPSAVAGYYVYRSTQAGGPYTLLNSSLLAVPSCTDNTAVAGVTYYYVVTALDSKSVESVTSNEVVAAIPR